MNIFHQPDWVSTAFLHGEPRWVVDKSSSLPVSFALMPTALLGRAHHARLVEHHEMLRKKLYWLFNMISRDACSFSAATLRNSVFFPDVVDFDWSLVLSMCFPQ